ncbi:MAG: hypothetical protein F6K28_39380 [Microcoleus sp. SIO2G3]|nr:hypothetical protein [Microcoleus sp. SIO2G3]
MTLLPFEGGWLRATFCEECQFQDTRGAQQLIRLNDDFPEHNATEAIAFFRIFAKDVRKAIAPFRIFTEVFNDCDDVNFL